jgi:hypothetical protein
MPLFNHLVRFENESGQVLYGDAPEDATTLDSLIGAEVDVFEGDTPWGATFQRTSKRDVIAKVCSRALSTFHITLTEFC